jgi:N-acetylglucosamine kinase
MICGIEGGATKASCVIAETRSGRVLQKVENIPLTTNQYLVGLPTAVDNILAVITQTMKGIGGGEESHRSGLVNVRFDCVVLSLSGICNESDARKMEEELYSRKAPECGKYIVCDDMKACSFCSPNPGGIVIIAGTGQNSMFYAPDGSDFVHKAGGWGHLIGDEGSGYFIANTAIKSVIRGEEGTISEWQNGAQLLFSGRHENLKRRLLSHFRLTDLDGLLDLHYKNFAKDALAGFCVQVIEAAEKDGDELALQILRYAGVELALLVGAHLPFIFDKFKMKVVDVVLVGSVWRSFDLFKQSFFQRLIESVDRFRQIRKLSATQSRITFRFLQLTGTSTHGALRMGYSYLQTTATPCFHPDEDWGLDGLVRLEALDI